MLKRKSRTQAVDLGWRSDLAYIVSTLGSSSLVAAFFAVLVTR